MFLFRALGYWLLVVGCWLSLYCQEPSRIEEWQWAHFTTESGLPSNVVERAVEVKDGTIWVQTSAGIAWFDSYRWHGMDSAISAPVFSITGPYRGDNIIARIGSKWFAVGKNHVSLLPLPDNVEVRISGDSLIFNDSSRVLRVLYNGNITPLSSQGNRRMKITASGISPEGTPWFTTADKGLCVWENNAARYVFSPRSDPIVVSAYAGDRNIRELFFVRSPHALRGLWERTPHEALHRVFNEDIPNILTADCRSNGLAIIVFDTGEIRYLYDGRWVTLDVPRATLGRTAGAGFCSNGDLFILGNKGVFLVRPITRWRSLALPFNERSNRVLELCRSRDGSLWIGTDGGAAVRHPGGNMELIDHIGGHKLHLISGIAEDDSGGVWVSGGDATGGVFRWNDREWTHFPIYNRSSDMLIHRIKKDREGRLWFLCIGKDTYGSQPGVYVYDKGQFSHWDTEQGLPDGRVYSFQEGPDGALWFGTHGGIGRWFRGAWQYWTTKDGMKSNKIFTLEVDDAGVAYFADDQVEDYGMGWIGLDGMVHYFPNSEGLLNHPVQEIKRDSAGALWVSTDAGICALSNGLWTRYDQRSGLQAEKIWPILPLSDAVYFGSIGDGVWILRRDVPVTPAPVLEMEKPGIDEDELSFRWHPYAFKGEIPSAEMETRYRLDGSGWSEWTHDHSILFHHVKTGDHVFRVQARGLFGQFDSAGQMTAAYIELPYFLRRVFVLPVGVLLAVIAFMSVQYLVRKRRDDRLLRQSEEKFRTVTALTSSAIFIYDSLRIYFINTAAGAFTGYSMEDVGTRALSDFIAAEDRDLFAKYCTLPEKETPEPHRAEFRIIARNGETRWLDFTSGSIHYQGRELRLGTAFDITERKHAEMRIKTLAFELNSTEQQSRRRMAAFLHDTIGQALALGRMKVEGLLSADHADAMRQSARELNALLQEAIQTTRTFTFELSPPVLFDLGLVPAIDWLMEQVQKRQNISITFSKPLLKILISDQVRNILFDGTRELLMNALKHSRATCLDIAVTLQDRTVTVTVHDDGVGFDMCEIARHQSRQASFGLFYLKERLADVGGALEIESASGAGTTVRLVAPLNKPEGDSP